MKIVADENIPDVDAYFAALGDVIRVDGRQLRREQLLSADILLVRSVTSVDESLLADTPVRFVASATIGVDHLDTAYLEQHNIVWANAPGCNANAVVEYVLSACCRIEGLLERLLNGGRVGIVGMGNVGSRLYQRLSALNIDCVAFDPLIDQALYPVMGDIDQVLEADMICLHTPLTTVGDYSTFHLFDEKVLQSLRPNTVLLNAGRGAVIDNAALLALLQKRDDIQVVLDVWEQEPAINRQLLERVSLATPHIAGYSLDGKLAGTAMIYQACCDFLQREARAIGRNDTPAEIRLQELNNPLKAITALVLGCYDIASDSHALRAAPQDFDRMRKNYPVRREFGHYHISNYQYLTPQIQQLAVALGFGH